MANWELGVMELWYTAFLLLFVGFVLRMTVHRTRKVKPSLSLFEKRIELKGECPISESWFNCHHNQIAIFKREIGNHACLEQKGF